MFPGFEYLHTVTAFLSSRAARLRETNDSGYTTETVVVIALLVAMAIAVIAIITAKVIAKANSLNLGLG